MSNQEIEGILTEFRSSTQCVVTLVSGDIVGAVLDTGALRRAHGRVFGIHIGGRVRVVQREPSDPSRVVWIEQVPQ